MYKLIKYSVFFFSVLVWTCSFSQKADSLNIIIRSEKNDTLLLKRLVKLREYCDPKDVIRCGEITVDVADKVIENKSLSKFKTNAISIKASALNSIALSYLNYGNTAAALENYAASLKLYEELKDESSVAILLNNIGNIHLNQKDYVKTLEYLNKSRMILEKLGDELSLGHILLNLGFIYSSINETEKALENFNRGKIIFEKMGEKSGMSMALDQIGTIYIKEKKYDEAASYFGKSLAIRKSLNEKIGIASTQNNLSGLYFDLKKYRLALAYADSALTLSKQLGFPQIIRYSEVRHYKADSAMGNYKEAYDHYKQHIIYRDSLNNENTRKISIKSSLKYEFEKKEAVIKEQQKKERAIAEEKDRFQKIVIASVIFGLLLVIIFAAFVFRSLKITRNQKHIIEEKQKEILDSIRYAKRIQTSLLPSEKYIQKQLQKK